MHRGDLLRQRLAAAEARLERIPATGPGEFGAPDPATGERWHRGNVLGHVAEMLPFWAGQAEAVLAGASTIGRGEAGGAARRAGIEQGAITAEADLRAAIADGVRRAERVLERVTPEDLERRVSYQRAEGADEITFGDVVERLIVGHFESHLDQLEELG